MIFTSEAFLYFFLPITLVFYFIMELLESRNIFHAFLTKIRLKDIIIIIFSLIFYSWNSFYGLLLLIFYVFTVYLLASILNNFNNKSIKKSIVFISVSILITFLIYVKYFDFLNIKKLLTFINLKEFKIPFIGISFITFSAISYIVDIYRGDATKGNIIDCFLYLTFFPKIISGPIVLWKNFQKQIKHRSVNLDTINNAVTKIILGLGKKAILADQFALYLSNIEYHNIDSITALSTLFIFPLQIYYDFSGYSDVAIGLSSLFGFQIDENFNYPYLSLSISEFWRRWHISLGKWFTEYIYIPLGGNRKSKIITLRNLAIVFLVTGIWHGASINYIIWGCLNGLAVIIERLIRDKQFYKNLNNLSKRLITLSLVFIFWQFFRFESLSLLSKVWSIILCKVNFEYIDYTWKYYLDAQIISFVIIGALLSFIPGTKIFKYYYNKLITNKLGLALHNLLLIIVFVLSILYIVNSSYTPFLYFQF